MSCVKLHNFTAGFYVNIHIANHGVFLMKIKKRYIRNRNPLYFAYKTYVTRARLKGLEFKISYDYFLEMSQKPCIYCGTEKSNVFELKRLAFNYKRYNGIDRVDSNLGYVPDNCVPCCKICNRAKSDLSMNDWREYISKVISYNAMNDS